MNPTRVLIVEDDTLIALDVELVLAAAGYEVRGVASSQSQALDLASALRSNMAIVDISLSPRDGRIVAGTLCAAYSTKVLFATGQCDEVAELQGAGAVACLPKPYSADIIPSARRAIDRLTSGDSAEALPDHMFCLAAA